MRYINVASVFNTLSARNMTNSINIDVEAHLQLSTIISSCPHSFYSTCMSYPLNFFDDILNTWDVSLLAML